MPNRRPRIRRCRSGWNRRHARRRRRAAPRSRRADSLRHCRPCTRTGWRLRRRGPRPAGSSPPPDRTWEPARRTGPPRRRPPRAPSREQFLRAPQPFGDAYSMRAIHRAGGARIATHLSYLRRQFKESLPAKRKLPISIRVSEEAQDLGDRQTLGARAVALAAHAAIERRDSLELPGEQGLVGLGEAAGHSLEILFELIHVGHARNGGID